MLDHLFLNECGGHLLPFLWLHGEEHTVLAEEIEKIYESGARSLCIESRPHPDFVGPGWWKDVDFILEECRRRGMRMYVLDDASFPTGYAAGAVTDADPALHKLYLTCSTLHTVGPLHKHWCFRSLGYGENLSYVVAVGEHGKRIDLTENIVGNRVMLELDDDRYTLYFFVTTTQAMGDRLDSYTNLLVKESVRILIDSVYEPHYARYQKDFGGVFAGFFSDESSFMSAPRYDQILGTGGPLPWSVFFLQQFSEKLGRNAVLLLPDLFADIGENTMPVRYAYMDLITELYNENMSCQVGNWCACHGVEYIGHVIEDDNAHARIGYGAGHFFRALDGQTMSGIDVVLHQLDPGLDDGFHKWPCNEAADEAFYTYCLAEMGVSAAATDSKKRGRTMCEIFGAYGWGEGNRLMKWMADFMLVRGVNFFVPHAFSPKPGIDTDCPPHFYTHGDNPQFKGFCSLCRYMERLASLFDGGKRNAPIAVLYHGEGEWGGKCMLTEYPMAVLKKHGINADILSVDILPAGELKDGTLHIGKGAYNTLVIPYMEAVPEKLIVAIKRLAKEGFPVTFVDALPQRESSGLQFSISELNGVNVVPLSELADLLDKFRTVRTSGYEPYLRILQYNKNDTDIWMFFNEHPTHRMKTRVETTSDCPALQYDAMEDVWYSSDMGNGNAELVLAPQEAKVFVFPKQAVNITLPTPPDISMRGTCLELNDFKVSYQSAGASDWTTEAPQDLIAFSGKIRYSVSFCLPSSVKHCVLNIENAGETVTGELNGNTLPIRLAWPYSWNIAALVKDGENQLILEVATTLVGQRQDAFSTYMALPVPGLTGAVQIFYET